MGSCGASNNKRKQTKSKNKNDRIKECRIRKSLPFETVDRCLSKVSKSICKIKIQTEIGIIKGTGFLLNFDIDQELFYCLISNEHVIQNDIIQNNNIIINISYDLEFKEANIKLENKKRYMKSFTDIDLDITIIEIIDEDNISKEYFLFPELENKINNKLIDKMIYIPQFVKGEELMNARGKIKKINENEITHLANTENGSSGSPILLENSIKVIGIHKEGNKYEEEYYGDFIYPAINIIKNDIREKKKNGKYNIDEFKNNLPNGKRTKYYSNENILKEGNFIKDKFENNGKLNYENGEYYIGECKNGNIMYEGDYINGKREGNGKYIFENGNYYIGQFKNGLFHGKGIEYYSNGRIKRKGN